MSHVYLVFSLFCWFNILSIELNILVDDTVSRIDMVSKIFNALYRLEITWSDIETNRQHHFNWRLSNSLVGKLSKSIYGSNRAGYRAKIMNV